MTVDNPVQVRDEFDDCDRDPSHSRIKGPEYVLSAGCPRLSRSYEQPHRRSRKRPPRASAKFPIAGRPHWPISGLIPTFSLSKTWRVFSDAPWILRAASRVSSFDQSQVRTAGNSTSERT